VTDNTDYSYLSYLVEWSIREPLARQFENVNGGKPFGVTLAQWLARAPGFNLDRVTTPLQLTALDRATLLNEWEAYMGLVLQGKPAELVYLPNGEHNVFKPWNRLTSQQGAVDWFCFWLKGEEDRDPTKADQYARWRELRKLDEHQATDRATKRGSN